MRQFKDVHAIKDGRSIVVRLKKAEDSEALGKMLESCSKRTYYFFHPYLLNRESGIRVADDENIICLIAFAGCQAVGFVWISRDGDCPGLGICVRDGYQELGVGRVLMYCIIKQARAMGKAGIQLTVMKDNVRGIALYQKCGFVIDGDAPDSFGPSYHMTLRF